MNVKKRRDSTSGLTARIRMWRDRDNEWHIAGEPDGFREVLSAFRTVARRSRDRSVVNLRTEPIPKALNPAAGLGVRRTYRQLNLLFDRNLTTTPRIDEDENGVSLRFSSSCKYEIGFALYEAIEGEGDFAVSVVDNERESLLWFWGYANIHGVNTFDLTAQNIGVTSKNQSKLPSRRRARRKSKP